MSRQFHALSLCVLLASCGPPGTAPAVRKDILLPRETVQVAARVPPGGTLESVLKSSGLAPHHVSPALAAVRSVFDPRQLRAGRRYTLVRTLAGDLREFEYEIDADRFLRVLAPDRSRPELLLAEVIPYDKDTAAVAVRGRIDADHPSVVAAITAAGETIHLALSLAELFAAQIDFENDLQPGDGFELLFQKSTREGEFAGYGPILGAKFIAGGRIQHAFRWTDPSTGKAAYYDENGRSLKRFFLRTPLKFEPRVTSGFSRDRLHPVFRTHRAHLGVDYAAPTGAAVVAVSSGTVVSAGWSGGSGNMVRLRHASGFESYYLHLSAFAKGIHPAARVEQGQVIGRVGATGTATGPHLDYRLRKNGHFVNPLAEHRKLPPGQPIPPASIDGFRAARDGILLDISTALLTPGEPRKPDALAIAR